MGPKFSFLLAAAWVAVPWIETRPGPKGEASGRGRTLLLWTIAGIGLAIGSTAPHPLWWIVWAALVWALEMEHRQAREGLRDLAEAPAIKLRRKIQPLEDKCRALQHEIHGLQAGVSAAVGRYLAKKDFHRSLRAEDLGQAVIDKMLKLTGANEAAVGIWNNDGRAILLLGHPADRVGDILDHGAWKREVEVESVRVRMAANGPGSTVALEESLKELILPLPALWRQSILYARVEEMAITDRLTGLYVHRLFAERLRQEIARVAETARPLSLIMVDVDHFKRFNDTFGHLLGDRVLRAIGQTFIADVRKSDFAARYGGEEMALLLPAPPLSGALLKAERLRKAVEKIKISHQDQMLGVTASFGVTEWSRTDQSPVDFIRRADQALYRAKENGRNRVEISEAG